MNGIRCVNRPETKAASRTSVKIGNCDGAASAGTAAVGTTDQWPGALYHYGTD